MCEVGGGDWGSGGWGAGRGGAIKAASGRVIKRGVKRGASRNKRLNEPPLIESSLESADMRSEV